MTSEPREELMSAYLDGELSPQERAQVEGWLAESAEMRQLLDELRTVRETLRALPRHNLARDLRPAVLASAERKMLSGSVPLPSTDSVQPGSLVRAWWSRGAGWRRLAWPTVAAAAALLIFLWDRNQKSEERPVAQRTPQGDSYIGAAPARPLAENAKPQVSQEGLRRRSREEAPSENLELERESAEATRPTNAGTPAAALAPAAPSAARALSGAQMAPQQKGASAPASAQWTVVCDVSPEFVRQRGLEILLDQKKIVWRRDKQADSSAGKDAPQQAASDEADPKSTPGAGEELVVEATGEQVDEIIAQLRKDRDRVADAALKSPSTEDLSYHLQVDQGARNLKQDAKQVVRFVLRIKSAAGEEGEHP